MYFPHLHAMPDGPLPVYRAHVLIQQSCNDSCGASLSEPPIHTQELLHALQAYKINQVCSVILETFISSYKHHARLLLVLPRAWPLSSISMVRPRPNVPIPYDLYRSVATHPVWKFQSIFDDKLADMTCNDAPASFRAFVRQVSPIKSCF
jgi:hypothetical protein